MAKKAKKARGEEAKSAVKTAKKTLESAKESKPLAFERIAGGLMPARHEAHRNGCFSPINQVSSGPTIRGCRRDIRSNSWIVFWKGLALCRNQSAAEETRFFFVRCGSP